MPTDPEERTLTDDDIETIVRGNGSLNALETNPDGDDVDDTDADDVDESDADDDATDETGGDTDATDTATGGDTDTTDTATGGGAGA